MKNLEQIEEMLIRRAKEENSLQKSKSKSNEFIKEHYKNCLQLISPIMSNGKIVIKEFQYNIIMHLFRLTLSIDYIPSVFIKQIAEMSSFTTIEVEGYFAELKSHKSTEFLSMYYKIVSVIMNNKYIKYHFIFSNCKKYLVILFFIYSLMKINPLKKIYKSPKISIYMPIYNKSKYLIKSIRSIQCQTLKEIEIIAVNDCSTDNSLIILKEIGKNDSRIKIVNNDKNYGLLYTRAMGILNSTGEYIINLDPDDLLNENNALKYLYNIANRLNLDIINFGYLKEDEFDLKCSNFRKILRQPKLLEHSFTSDDRINDFLLWNKLVKRELMLKAYELFKNEIYSEKWNYGEDTIWSIIINKYARSMLCINKIIYIYYLDNVDFLL